MSSDSLLLIGSYRSGTTWVSTILAESFKAEYNFEPLEPRYCPEVKSLKLRNRYLRPGSKHPRKRDFLKKAVTGRLYRLPIKTMSRNPIYLYRWKFWRRRKIIKMIQGHLSLPFLKENFGSPIVFLIRHPSAVIESLTRQSWWNSDLHEFMDGRNQELFEDYPSIYRKLKRGLEYLNSQPESEEVNLDRLERVKRTALRWSLENYFVLSLATELGLLITKYESFYKKPIEEIDRIANYWGIEDWVVPSSLRKPSNQIDSNSPLLKEDATPLTYWQDRLTEKEREAVENITKEFNFALGQSKIMFSEVVNEDLHS